MARCSSAASLDPALVERTVDQRVMLRCSWRDYETLLAIRGDGAGVRMAYLEGMLELMTPSRDHETLKKTLARPLEAYGEELGIELEGYGSWTLNRRDRRTRAPRPPAEPTAGLNVHRWNSAL